MSGKRFHHSLFLAKAQVLRGKERNSRNDPSPSTWCSWSKSSKSCGRSPMNGRGWWVPGGQWVVILFTLFLAMEEMNPWRWCKLEGQCGYVNISGAI